jgi:hypothetical protein
MALAYHPAVDDVREPEVTGPEPADDRRETQAVRRDRRVEMLAAILLSVATVLTAWSAYQATRWSGVQAESYTTASARRTESVRATGVANRQILIDVDVFINWLDAADLGNEGLANDLRDRMRDEFRPAFDAWLATGSPGQIPEGTPFDRPEYRLEALEESDHLEAEAAAAFDEGGEANQISDNFVLAAVLFASVLFFSGLAGTFDSIKAQVMLLVLAGLMIATGTVIVFSLPQNVGF